MSVAEIHQGLKFYPSARVEEIISDETLPDEQKKSLIAALGPDAGVFAPEEEVSEAK